MQDDNLLGVHRIKYEVRVAPQRKNTYARLICRATNEREMGKRVERSSNVCPYIVSTRDAAREEIVANVREVIDGARIEPYASRHGRRSTEVTASSEANSPRFARVSAVWTIVLSSSDSS